MGQDQFDACSRASASFLHASVPIYDYRRFFCSSRNARRWKSPQKALGVCLQVGQNTSGELSEIVRYWRLGDPNSGTDKPDGKHRMSK